MTESTEHSALLRMLVERGGSDLHCKAGSAPAMRRSGVLERLEVEAFTAEGIARMAKAMLNEDQQKVLLRDGSVVVAHGEPGVGRFRVAVFRQRGSAAMVIRAVPHEITPLEQLGLPTAAESLAAMDQGLVLIASPVSNGATTTLSAMVDHVNRNRSVHIVTVDQPIEALHRDQQALVSQLDVGADVRSLAEGVRSASSIDADVVSVSDIPSRDVASACLDAVARGRLVFGIIGGDTVHSAVNGFLELFTFEERPIVRQTFSRALVGVLAQRLLPGTDGSRVPVAEAMFKTAKIETILADESRMAELPALLREGVFHGMQTMDQSIKDQIVAGRITEETGLASAVDAEELRIELMRG